jgi:outer membrane lipoprotein-sorting protein
VAVRERETPKAVGWKAWGLMALLFLSLALAQGPQEILSRMVRNLDAPWQAEVRGEIQGPGGKEEFRARVYAISRQGLFRIEYLKPGSLEGNFTVITDKEVWNYLYLTNQLIISPKEKAQVSGLGFNPALLGNAQAMAERLDLRLLGRVSTPQGPAYRLLGQPKPGEALGFREVELWILEEDPRPVRFIFRGEGGQVLGDLQVVAFQRANLTPAGLKRYPKDAQVVRR